MLKSYCFSAVQVRKSIIGFDHNFIAADDTSSAWEAGFGSLYWMEGVAIRLQVGVRGSLRGVEVGSFGNSVSGGLLRAS